MNLVRRGIVDGLITLDDFGVLRRDQSGGRVRCNRVDFSGEGSIVGLCLEKARSVDVGDTRIDE